MVSRLKQAALASALAATALTGVTPAMAQGYPYGDNGGYRQRDRGDSTGAAIIGGVVGIAIGALIASSGNRNRHNRGHAGLEYRDGHYYDREGRRCDRDGRPYENQGYYRRRGYEGGYGHREGYRGGDRGHEGGYGYREGYRGGDRGYDNQGADGRYARDDGRGHYRGN